jgi:hypothetical protein
VKALLAKRDPAEYTEQRAGVVLVADPLGDVHHIGVPAGLAVQLGQRRRRIGGQLEVLNDLDGGRQVAGLLVELSEYQPDAVAAYRSSTPTPGATSNEKDERRYFCANGWAAGSCPLANTQASNSVARAWLPWVAAQEPNSAAASTP